MAKKMAFDAIKVWSAVPDEHKEAILANVFCATCTTTKIVDYSMEMDGGDVVLKGTCAKCGGSVARLVENPNY